MAIYLDVHHLELVAGIVEHGTLTHAARALNVTQSALSHRLSDLEDRLGVLVFKRVGRSLQLSMAGRYLLAVADEVLPRLRAAQEDMDRIAQGILGTIRISTECYTCYHWLPGVITRFRSHHPEVDVSIVMEATRSPIPALLDATIDIGLVSRVIEDSRFHYQTLFDDELVALVSPTHPWAECESVAPDDFGGQHIVLYDTKDNDFLEKFLTPAGVRPGRISRVQITEGIIELAKASLGIAVLARWAAAPELDAGNLKALRLGDEGLRRCWYAVTLSSHLSTAEQSFVNLLREEMNR